MTPRRTALLLLISIASASFAIAQETTPKDPTAPSAASSPHQRKSTTTEAAEAQPRSGAQPADASSPHQRQATRDSKDETMDKQMMKDCMSKQQAKDSTMSKTQAKKACMDEMKMHKKQTEPY